MVSATAMCRDRRATPAPPRARRTAAYGDLLQRSSRVAPPAALRGEAPRDDLGDLLLRCREARTATPAAPRQPVLQRVHVGGAKAPAAVCKSFAALAKLAANPYPTTVLNFLGIGDSPAVQSDRLSQMCRAWLSQFDSTPVDHTRFAKLDFLTRDVTWPLTTNMDTWAQLRQQVVEWRTAAEEQYVLDSEVSDKDKPDPEEYEQQLKLAWSGASGAFG